MAEHLVGNTDLKSMEISAADAAKFDQAFEPENPKFFHGLRLHMEEGAIAKLGMTEMPEVNQDMELKAIVKVVDLGVDENKEGQRRHMSLQITSMALHKSGEEKKPKGLAEKLFKRDNPDDRPGIVLMDDN